MDILYTIHPVSVIGIGIAIPGLCLAAFLFFNNELSFGRLKLKGSASRSKKWPKMFWVSIGLIVLGGVLFGLGFKLERPVSKDSLTAKRHWLGTWNVQFQGNCQSPVLFQDAESIRFYEYDYQGKPMTEAQIKDSQGRVIGSFQRLESSMGNEDYRVIKGQCKIEGAKTVLVELALLRGRESFSGMVFDRKTSTRYTCWGVKP